ncbi:MAG: DUF167 domain-containing protein [Nanoarchaeota archaeon]|nr:DUF167 domain-containing protein [Nanoarchaeota archaeon]
MKIKINVKPNSGKQEIEKEGEGYVVCLKSAPENGKANVELLKLLQRYFKREVKIKSGVRGRNKIIEVLE